MNIHEIANMPTVLNTKEFVKKDDVLGNIKHERLHESLCRSFHIVAKVRELLQKNTPSDVVLEIMDLLESDLFQPYAWHEQRYHEQGQPVITAPPTP